MIDEGVIAKQALDVGALHAPAASVNQPDLREARLARRAQVLFDDRDDIPRREAVEIDYLLNRNPDGLVIHWLDITLPVALVAAWLGCFVWQLRGRAILPVHDPQFEQALGRIASAG